MSDREKVISHLAIIRTWAEVDQKCGGINPECCADIVKWIDEALELLKGNESEWLEDSDPGQEYGTTWACRKCWHSIHEQYVWNPYECGMGYCPFCGERMVINADEQ